MQTTTELMQHIQQLPQGVPHTPLPKLMRNFLDFDAVNNAQLAFIQDSGETLTYGALKTQVDEFAKQLPATRSLILMAVENSLAPLIAYLAALRSGHVVMLIPSEKQADITQLQAAYMPNYVYTKKNDGWTLTELNQQPLDLHPDLALMLATSGSTGSAKFVRLSYLNIMANAASIAEYLNIGGTDRALMTLPFHYSYGLSVVHSHLLMGATLLVTQDSVTSPALWTFFKDKQGTSFAGVPYVFELLERIQFQAMSLPSLRTVTQAGGRLQREKVIAFANWAQAQKVQFFVMYGQTEGTARMSYVPPAHLLEYPDTIGVAIPAGKLMIVDAQGSLVTAPNQEGEIYYEGPNVMMGYAERVSDLALAPSLTRLATGDLGFFNAKGLFKVSGRKSRFVKIYGLRIALDALEISLNQQGYSVVAGGSDEQLVFLILNPSASQSLQAAVAAQCQIPLNKILVKTVNEFPLLPSGKVDYATINAMATASTASHPLLALKSTLHHQTINTVTQLYQQIFSAPVAVSDTFIGLGGDSLLYVQAVLGLEKLLGHLPDNWEHFSVAMLEKVVPTTNRYSAMDIASLIRALAIIGIVALHFHLSPLAGGAYLLMVVAGYNFARFQFEKVKKSNSVQSILYSALKIYIPCVALIGFRQISRGTFYPSNFFMTATLFNNLDYYWVLIWFIEALLQIYLLVALLLSVPTIKQLAEKNSFYFALNSALLLAFIGYFLRMHFNMDVGIRYQSFSVAWLFFMGWATYNAHSQSEKYQILFCTGLMQLIFLMGGTLSHFHMLSFSAVLLVGVSGLLFIKTVKLPRWLSHVLGKVAAASMFIYLTHFIFQQHFQTLFGKGHPLAEFAVAIAGGYAIWLCWEKIARVVLKNLFHKGLMRMGVAHKTP